MTVLLLVESTPFRLSASNETKVGAPLAEDFEPSWEESAPNREILGAMEEYREADTKHFLSRCSVDTGRTETA
ncbi:MAG TPA: hypothetical protein PL100_01720 [Bacillota bacterium]|nr:hypothetical protein [Bacillota bacterium]HQC48235.1 hypothetical protein [Bacillota bacterium]